MRMMRLVTDDSHKAEGGEVELGLGESINAWQSVRALLSLSIWSKLTTFGQYFDAYTYHLLTLDQSVCFSHLSAVVESSVIETGLVQLWSSAATRVTAINHLTTPREFA